MQALLNFDQYIVDDLSVRTNGFKLPKGRGKSVETWGEVKIQFDIKQNKGNDTAYMIPLTIEVNESQGHSAASPYYIFLAIRGFFSFNKREDPETTAKMISLNGLSMLYGVARGIVGQATASCPHGRFILPSVNFIELLKRKASEIADGEQPETPTANSRTPARNRTKRQGDKKKQ